MSRWKPLPEKLDPRIAEFAGQLRGVVDRGGPGLAAVARRTGYSRTSWERYLNGRLHPPQGAVLALAEATGAEAAHLTTLWERAGRAWSDAGAPPDTTAEALRAAEARAALEAAAPGAAAAPAAAGKRRGPRLAALSALLPGKRGTGRPAAGPTTAAPGTGAGTSGRTNPGTATAPAAGPGTASATPPTSGRAAAQSLSKGGSAKGAPARSGSAATASAKGTSASGAEGAPSSGKVAWPTATPGPDLAVWSALTKSGAPQSGAPQPGAAKSGAAAGEARPAGSAISKGAGNPSAAPAPTSAAPADGAPAQPGAASAGSAPTGTPAPAADKAAATPPATATTAGSASAPAAPRATGWRAVLPTVLSGALGALLVIVATVLLTGSWGGFGFGGDDRGQGAAPSAPAPGRSAASLPPGVRCSGAGCTGKDPEAMGCGGAHATTVAARAVGAGAVEIRYSKVCGAAWARLTRADAGDRVTLTVNGTTREGEAAGTSDAYTPMVAVPGKARPTACAVRPDGSRNCATPLTGG